MSKLNAKDRRNLLTNKEDNFGFPEKAPESGSYPINDPAHARAALARGKQFLPANKLEQLRNKIKMKFPWMKIRKT